MLMPSLFYPRLNFFHSFPVLLFFPLLQWAEALVLFLRAADTLGLVSRKSLWGQFWSAHQRFFKYLCISAKVRRLVELAKTELEQGKVSTVHVLSSFFPYSTVMGWESTQKAK